MFTGRNTAAEEEPPLVASASEIIAARERVVRDFYSEADIMAIASTSFGPSQTINNEHINRKPIGGKLRKNRHNRAYRQQQRVISALNPLCMHDGDSVAAASDYENRYKNLRFIDDSTVSDGDDYYAS